MDSLVIEGYTIGERIGSGAFANVFMVERNNVKYAAKIIFITKKQKSMLFNEYTILRNNLYDTEGVVKVATYKPTQNFKIKHYEYLIMEYLEPKPIDDIKLYFKNLVLTLKEIHKKGFIHNDLKPDNIIAGKIIDFGLATNYINCMTNKCKEQKSTKGELGTTMYSSIHSNSLLTNDLNGDLQSLGYILLEITSGLPWKLTRSREEIRSLKRVIFVTTEFIKAPMYVQAFIQLTYNVPYGARPYYEELIKILE